MRPFGIIILIFVFGIFLKNNRFKDKYMQLLTLTICVETFINFGYFIKLGTYELQYSEFLLGILGIMALFLLFFKPLNKKVFIIGCFLIGSVLISNILLILFPSDRLIITFGMGWQNYFQGNMVSPVFSMQTIKMSLRILLYIIIAITAMSVLDRKDIEYIEKRFVQWGVFVIIFGIIELVLKNIFRSNITHVLNSWVFGLGNWTTEVLLERGSLYSLQGFMREPSHFAGAMFSFGLILIFSSKPKKFVWKMLVATCVIMVLSRSFAAIMYIGALYAIYAVVNNKKLIYSGIAISIFPIFLFSNYFSYYIDRFSNIFSLFNLMEASRTMSEHVRLISIIENIKIFLNRPLFGIGVGTTYAHGFLPTILASIGLTGTALWVSFLFSGIAQMKISYKNIFVIFILLLTWIFTANMGNAYSMSLLLMAFLINYKYGHSFKNIVDK